MKAIMECFRLQNKFLKKKSEKFDKLEKEYCANLYENRVIDNS